MRYDQIVDLLVEILKYNGKYTYLPQIIIQLSMNFLNYLLCQYFLMTKIPFIKL
jgi:hypothetical protein